MDAALGNDIQLTEYRQNVEQGHAECEDGSDFAKGGILFSSIFLAAANSLSKDSTSISLASFFRHRLSSLV